MDPYSQMLTFFLPTIINIWQVFAKGVDNDMVVLMAARASRLENQDAIDCAIVSMLADPKEVQVQRCLIRLTTLKAFPISFCSEFHILLKKFLDDSLINTIIH